MSITDNYNILIKKLDEFIRKYYKNLLLRGGLYFLGLAVFSFLVITILEFYGQFEVLLRTFLFYAYLSVNGFILVKYVLIPLFKLYKLGENISNNTAAQIIGKHFVNVQDKLLNVLQLKELSQKPNVSQELIEASINQKIEELKPVPFVNAIHFSENRKYIKYLAVPLLLLIAVLIASPRLIPESTERLIEYNKYFEKKAPFEFIIQNPKLEAIQYEDFELNIRLTGNELPQNIYLRSGKYEFKADKISKIDFRYVFKNLQSDAEFQLTADGYSSKPYDISVLPNPIILTFEIKLDYPFYLNKKDEIQLNSGELLVPAGTEVTWNFTSQNTDHIKLAFPDTILFASNNGTNSFSYTKKLFSGGFYIVAPSNKKLISKDSVVYNINIIPDLFPSIDVEEQIDSVLLKNYYFLGTVKDDHAISKLTFNYRFLNSSDSVLELRKIQSLEIPIHKNVSVDQFYHYWDMDEINISAGDVIEYYFQVWDNDAVMGPKYSTSKKGVYKSPDKDELKKLAQESNESIKSQLASGMEEAKELKEDIKKFREKLLAKKELSWEDKKALEKLLEQQKKLLKDIEKINKENSLNNDNQDEISSQEQRLKEKKEKLEELFEKVVDEETQKLFEELQRLMEEMNRDKLMNKLDEFELSNTEMEKELDRMLELFKQLEFEQKLQQAIDELNKLHQKEEDLSEKSKDKKSISEELANEQQEINKQFDELKKDLKDLEKKDSELEFPHGMEPTDEDLQAIQNDMNQSMDELQKGNNKKSSESQKGASKKMEKMAQQLEAMQSNMEMQSSSEDIDDLRQLLENIIKLSFEQENIMDELNAVKTTDPRYVEITQQQFKLKEDAKMIEDSLLALSKRVPEISSFINKEIGEINHNMGKSIEALSERNTANARTKQQYVMTSLNNMAVLLSEVLEQLQKQMASQMPGTQQCQKPGGAGSKPKMSEMQKQLNDQIKEMKNNMGMPGKLGQKSQLSKELARTAAQQAALRRQLEKLNELQNKDGTKKLGDLEKISELMDQTETDLVHKQITEETLKRQEEIMIRLLESEKAMREQDSEDTRESNEANNVDKKRNQNPFHEYKRRKSKEIELLKTVPPSLNPYYKEKVNWYFQKIEN